MRKQKRSSAIFGVKRFQDICRLVVTFVLGITGPLASAQEGIVRTDGVGTAGVHIESFANRPDVAIKTGNATTSALRVFNSANTELLRVSANGNVGIGTATPTARLTVFNDKPGVFAFIIQQRSAYSANTDGSSTDIAGASYMTTVVPAGVTHYGTALGMSGLSYLEGAGSLRTAFGLIGEAVVTPGSTGTVMTAYGVYSRVAKNNGSVGTGYGLYIADVGATSDYGVYQAGTDDSNYFGGDMTVGATGATGTKLTVNGNVSVTGSLTGASVIGAVYQDMAEWVPASSDMEPGTVVVLNQDRVNEVMLSYRAYDTSVAGVVSAQPGIILGVGGDSKEQIATTGRVKVRVDATRSPVRIGDLLVTSDVPGTAMRSEPMEMNDRRFHQPGTIIGKALQPLASGVGEILVLLSLQ